MIRESNVPSTSRTGPDPGSFPPARETSLLDLPDDLQSISSTELDYSLLDSPDKNMKNLPYDPAHPTEDDTDLILHVPDIEVEDLMVSSEF